jgi:DDE superfamily endonuclease
LKEEWCLPTVSPEFVWRMEDVLDLYAEPYDPAYPVVCFDESPYQMISETRVPVPVEQGKPQRIDYEYKREGTCNLFMFFQPLGGWRHVKVTERRTAKDYAQCMKDLVDEHFPDAILISVVQDNLNTHTGAALYETFAPAEARRILNKLDFRYTPKHGSWLNMAEVEIGVVLGQCLDQRIPTMATVRRKIGGWERRRNTAKAMVNWRFTTRTAREKLKRLYPS